MASKVRACSGKFPERHTASIDNLYGPSADQKVDINISAYDADDA
jgi:hypothetical protein